MKRGYTLIEGVIYVALLAMIATVIVSILLLMSRSFFAFRVIRGLTHSANVSMERLSREIRQATSVNLVSSTLNTSPGRLTLNTTDAGGSPTTISFFITGTTLMVQPGSSAAASSTAPTVRVDNLVFRYLTTPKSQAVRIELTLTDTRGPAPRSEKFYNTLVLRGSY